MAARQQAAPPPALQQAVRYRLHATPGSVCPTRWPAIPNACRHLRSLAMLALDSATTHLLCGACRKHCAVRRMGVRGETSGVWYLAPLSAGVHLRSLLAGQFEGCRWAGPRRREPGNKVTRLQNLNTESLHNLRDVPVQRLPPCQAACLAAPRLAAKRSGQPPQSTTTPEGAGART